MYNLLPRCMSTIEESDADRLTWREFVVDVVMLVLIIANLAFIIFDWTFANSYVQDVLAATVPTFHDFYASEVHPHFLFYDLIFVAIFLTEIIIRWGLAIYRQTYRRWYFYPIVHWYDVLGCIPVGTFRSLRVLRIFSMIPKMQRLGIIDLRQTALYDTLVRYRDWIVQELTDRVTLRILDGVQHEIERNHPVVDRIAEEVIRPQHEALVEALTHRLQEATAKAYGSYRTDFQQYMDGVIQQAVNNNREIKTIGMIPGVGPTIAHLLQSAISDIVYSVINQMMDDVGSRENDKVMAQITTISVDAAFSDEFEQTLNELVRSLIVDSLDVIKDQIDLSRWDPKHTPARDASPVS